MKKSIFWTVTGRDFGRSIAWALLQPVNPVTAAMRAAALKNFEPKNIIQHGKSK